MTAAPPRLSFSHAGQDFIVKSRPTLEGVEVRGFWHARSTARTRFARVVPNEMIQDAGRRGATDPVRQALEGVRDQITAAIDNGEPLTEGTGP